VPYGPQPTGPTARANPARHGDAVSMEKIARVLSRHPPSDQRPAAPPAQVTAPRDLLSVRAETLASRPIVACALR